MNREVLKTRLKALAVHLVLSLVLTVVALGLILACWLPPPLFSTDGGGMGLKLIVLVDLVLGPLLTFIVFNPAKSRRELSLDLSLIAIAQLSAYAWGLHNIHSVRVVAVAYSEGVFHSVTADAYSSQMIADDSWQKLGAAPPYLVDVRAAANGDEASGAAAFAMLEGLAPYQLQFLYVPFSQASDAHRDAGWTLAELRAAKRPEAERAERWLADKGYSDAEVHFYPLQGYFASAVLAVSDKGERLGGFAGQLPAQLPTP